jgi:hypothetical protein
VRVAVQAGQARAAPGTSLKGLRSVSSLSLSESHLYLGPNKKSALQRRAAAKETGALMGQKVALEKKLEELQTRVMLDKRWRDDATKSHAAELAAVTEKLEAATAAAGQLQGQLAHEVRLSLPLSGRGS